MSITLPCFHEGKFIGVAGTDINMDDLLSDITFFNQGQSTYAFMVSNSGRTLIHPLLPAPTDAYGDPVFLDIRTLEPEAEFEDVFFSIKRFVQTMLLSDSLPFVALNNPSQCFPENLPLPIDMYSAGRKGRKKILRSPIFPSK